MKTERPDMLVHVAANVRRLRQAAELSQAVLAEQASVSRRMLVNIEKGEVNVSLNTLDRIAEALGVLFHALIAPPDAADTARINEIAWVGRSPQSRATLLASTSAAQEVELWAWVLAAGERYESPADPAGWREMLYVIEGVLALDLSGERRRVEAGDFIVYATDRPHAYINDTPLALRFIRNVVY